MSFDNKLQVTLDDFLEQYIALHKYRLGIARRSLIHMANPVEEVLVALPERKFAKARWKVGYHLLHSPFSK